MAEIEWPHIDPLPTMEDFGTHAFPFALEILYKKINIERKKKWKRMEEKAKTTPNANLNKELRY